MRKYKRFDNKICKVYRIILYISVLLAIIPSVIINIIAIVTKDINVFIILIPFITVSLILALVFGFLNWSKEQKLENELKEIYSQPIHENRFNDEIDCSKEDNFSDDFSD